MRIFFQILMLLITKTNPIKKVDTKTHSTKKVDKQNKYEYECIHTRIPMYAAQNCMNNEIFRSIAVTDNVDIQNFSPYVDSIPESSAHGCDVRHTNSNTVKTQPNP